jgi:hypothetical protein
MAGLTFSIVHPGTSDLAEGAGRIFAANALRLSRHLGPSTHSAMASLVSLASPRDVADFLGLSLVENACKTSGVKVTPCGLERLFHPISSGYPAKKRRDQRGLRAEVSQPGFLEDTESSSKLPYDVLEISWSHYASGSLFLSKLHQWMNDIDNVFGNLYFVGKISQKFTVRIPRPTLLQAAALQCFSVAREFFPIPERSPREVKEGLENEGYCPLEMGDTAIQDLNQEASVTWVKNASDAVVAFSKRNATSH